VANDEGLFREVDQNLAEDKLWTDLRRNGPYMLGAAVAIVLAVGGMQVYNHQKISAAEDAAREYRTTMELFADDEADGREALELFVENAPVGYRTVGNLQLAASYAASGDAPKALELYRAIYGDAGRDRLGDLARLRAAYLSLRNSREEVLSDVGDLAEETTPFGFYAKELVALAALKAGDYQAAESSFQELSRSLEAPAPIRDRAEEFRALASSGKAGVEIAWPTEQPRMSIDDYFDAIGTQEGGLGAILEAGGDDSGFLLDDAGEDHSGHDHGDEGETEATSAESEDAVADETAVLDEAPEETIDETSEAGAPETTADDQATEGVE
jgi:hypothetical protein